MNTAFAANPGQLRSTERSTQIAQDPGVDPDDAGVDTGGHAPAAAEIAGPYGRGEPVRRVVCERKGLFFRVERRDVAAGTEDLLAHDPRSLGKAGPDSGLNPRASCQRLSHLWNATPTHDPRALFLLHTVISQHLVSMLDADQRPDAGTFIRRVPGLHALRTFTQRVYKALEYLALDVNSLGAQADLAAIHERRPADAGDRSLEGAVAEHDARVLAPELERHRAHAGRGRLHNRLTRPGFAGEGHGRNAGMFG